MGGIGCLNYRFFWLPVRRFGYLDAETWKLVPSGRWAGQGGVPKREREGSSGGLGSAEEGFEFDFGGHGGLGAVTGDGDGGDGGGIFDAGDGVGAAEEGGGEGAVEGVAGGGGVDGFYAIRRNQGAFAGGERDVAAAFAEFAAARCGSLVS